MRKFVSNTLCFLFVLIILNTLINHFSNDLYLGTYKEVSLNFNSFLLSDSHGLPLGENTKKYGIYNFSAGSESYIDMKRKLNFLIKKTKVDTIYITVDDHTLSHYRENSNNLDRSVFYTTVEDYPNIFIYLKDKLMFNIAFFQPKKGSFLKRSFLSTIKNSITNNVSSNNEKITEWIEMNKTQRLELSKIRFSNQFSTKKKSIKLEKALKQIIKKCKENNIVLIGIRYPLVKDYIGLIDNFTGEASELFKENGLNVLDYTDVYVNKNEYFANQDHLNIEGGRIFTDLVFGNAEKARTQNTSSPTR